MGRDGTGTIIKVKFRETVVLPRIIPRDEIEQLLNTVYMDSEKTGSRFGLRDIAVIETLFATGARVYEVSNIQGDCVDLRTGNIRIKENERAIKNSGYFFVNCRGNRFSEQSIRTMVKRYTKLAGIERNITPHMFRQLLEVSTLQIRMGNVTE